MPFKSFFQRHRGLTAFLGASLVLATFLVKDEMRDQAKDAAQDADSKIAEYSAYMQTCDIITQIQIMRIDLLVDVSSLTPQSQTGINWSFITAFRSQTDAQSASVASMLAAARQYLSPDDLKIFTQRCNDLLKQRADLSQTLAKAITLPHAKANAQLQAVMVQSNQYSQSLDVQLASVREYVTQYLTNQRIASVRRYDQVSAASYFLYAIGWIVGLSGKVLGKKSSDDDDE